MMNTRIATALAAGVLVLIAAVQPRAQGNALSREAVVTIEKEVTAALQNYYRLYTEKDDAALGPEVFFEPWLQLGARGPQVMHTAQEEIAARFAESVKGLQAQGWVKSAYPKPIICVINAGTAIASGEFMRYRADGSVISVNGTTYLFSKTPRGWRVVSYFGHEVGKVIGCNDGVQ